jgi:uncharacterized small protein (TIGR04563 family)
MAQPKTQSDKTKQSLYFPGDMLDEIHEEAKRLDRSVSWIVARAWKIARRDIKEMPDLDNVK